MQAVHGRNDIRVIDDESLQTQGLASAVAMVGVLLGLVAFFLMFAPVS